MRTKSRLFPVALILIILIFPPAYGQEVNIETAAGLYITTFDTPKGRIKVHIPDGVAAGDTISGTAILEPIGNTGDEKNANLNTLSGYFLELENEKIPLTQSRLKWTIPSTLTGGAAFIVIWDKDGNELNRAVVPVRGNSNIIQQPINPSQWEYVCPTVGREGKPIQIQGPFDGNFDTTGLKIGGKEVRLIAESPRKLVFESPKDVLGVTQLELKEGEIVVKRNFNNLRVVKINEEFPTLVTAKRQINAETEKGASKEVKQLPEKTQVQGKPKEVNVEPEKEGILRTKEIHSASHQEKPTEVKTKSETTQKNEALAAKIEKNPPRIENKSITDTTRIDENGTPLPSPRQQIKLEDQQPSLPKKKIKDKPELKLVETKKQRTEKKDSVDKDSLPVTNLEKQTLPGKEKTKKETVKVDEKETNKQQYRPTQTPAALKRLEAKVASKPNIAQKRATTYANTKESAKPKAVTDVDSKESDDIYTIQVASYKKESEARDLAEELKSKGYAAFVKQGEVPQRGTWHRVRVGKFKTVKEASRFAYNLKNQEKEIQSFLITENN